MRCRQARKATDELLNGTLRDRSALDDHLATCEACTAQCRRLERLAALAREEFHDPVAEAELERLTAAVLGKVGGGPEPAPRSAAWLRPALVLGAVALAFALGLQSGRSLWPQRVVRQEVIQKPGRVEHVEVEVPVVKERVVVKHVTVVRTRVVYAERSATPEAASRVDTAADAEAVAPVVLDEVVVPMFAANFASRPLVTQEWVPVGPAADRELAAQPASSDAEPERETPRVTWAVFESDPGAPQPPREELCYAVPSRSGSLD